MKAILSCHPSCGVNLLSLDGKQEILRKGGWLYNLIKDKYSDESIEFLGRDEAKRVEIQMNVELFTKLKNEPLFIMNADKLRRLRTVSNGVLDFLLNPEISLIDNDLDRVNL